MQDFVHQQYVMGVRVWGFSVRVAAYGIGSVRARRVWL